MPTTFLLARHGETEWNRDGRWQGQSDVALSALGLAQARALGQRLAPEPVAAIYSSDLIRARATADAIARALARPAPVHLDRRLREVDVGRIAGLTRREVAEAFPEFWAALKDHPVDTRFPGGETFRELEARVLEAVQEIAARHPDETVVVVTHGGVIRSVVAWVLGLDPERRGRLLLDNCGLTVIEWSERPRLRTLNETGFLAAVPDGEVLRRGG
ncbi:histidine phosphatase family protein [Caldinitratiruptor microaerophilus]|nr:histidine phosphatase family protein [Caldinitratiruptor microaerophilus]